MTKSFALLSTCQDSTFLQWTPPLNKDTALTLRYLEEAKSPSLIYEHRNHRNPLIPDTDWGHKWDTDGSCPWAGTATSLRNLRPLHVQCSTICPQTLLQTKLESLNMRVFEMIILSNYKYLTRQKGLWERKPYVIEFIKLQREWDMITLSTSRYHFTSSKHSQIIN